MKTGTNKDWVNIQLINVRKKKAQINRLLKQDFLIFSGNQIAKFNADLAVLSDMEQDLLKKLTE